MRSRGAARFVYLNKSGLDRSVASDFVSDLRNTGADVTIVRGDVCSFADVVHAVGKIQSPLGGVVQAAMGLDVSRTTTLILLSLIVAPGIPFCLNV